MQRLLAAPGIIRNRAKIQATIANATIALRDHGGLPDLLWSFKPDDTPRPRTVAQIPTRSTESAALAKELRRRGFAFVGPTTMYALMEAIGIIDTHLMDSHRRATSGIWPH
ncbi:DNA-3-methyladenine glycosylase I [Streptomyces mirabilis]|uniref:DNA-3-methyladenine glycosylase I n=1 Tax=Streptomyces mirabilis TaxID=68239 RepID=UPI0036F12972